MGAHGLKPQGPYVRHIRNLKPLYRLLRAARVGTHGLKPQVAMYATYEIWMSVYRLHTGQWDLPFDRVRAAHPRAPPAVRGGVPRADDGAGGVGQ